RSEITSPPDNPFGFTNLPIFYSQTQCHNGSLAALFNDSEIACLSRDGVQESTLYLAERRHGLPHSIGRPHHHCIFCLTESGKQRRGRRVVLDDGVQVLIES